MAPAGPGRLAVLHHARSFFAFDLREMVGEGVEFLWVLVDDSADPSARRVLGRLGTIVDLAGLDLPSAAQCLAEYRPDGLVTFVDDHLEVTAQLAAALGLRYHTPAVAATLADKLRQRERLAEAGVPGPQFWPVPADVAEVASLADAITYPAVLKPAAGSGSRGIGMLAGPADLLALHEPGVKQFVEAYLEDDPRRDARFASYLSVESVVDGAQRTHVAVCGRFALASPFRETGNFIPAAIDPSEVPALHAITDAAIGALDITIGVLHTEIKLTPEGPSVLELNGRLGGRPPFVLRRVSNVNLFRVACDLALGRPVAVPDPAECDGVGYWRMLQPPQSAVAVRAVNGLEALSEVAHVASISLFRRPGDPVDWREGTDGRVLTVQGRVTSREALAAAIAEIEAVVQIEYENGERSPAD